MRAIADFIYAKQVLKSIDVIRSILDVTLKHFATQVTNTRLRDNLWQKYVDMNIQ